MWYYGDDEFTSEMIGDYGGVQKGIDWFIENNCAAYMALLD